MKITKEEFKEIIGLYSKINKECDERYTTSALGCEIMDDFVNPIFDMLSMQFCGDEWVFSYCMYDGEVAFIDEEGNRTEVEDLDVIYDMIMQEMKENE